MSKEKQRDIIGITTRERADYFVFDAVGVKKAALSRELLGVYYIDNYHHFVSLSRLNAFEQDGELYFRSKDAVLNVVNNTMMPSDIGKIYKKILGLTVPEEIAHDFPATDESERLKNELLFSDQNLPFAVIGLGYQYHEPGEERKEAVVLHLIPGLSPKDALAEFNQVVLAKIAKYNLSFQGNPFLLPKAVPHKGTVFIGDLTAG